MVTLRRTCATVPQPSELWFGVVRAVGRGIAVLNGVQVVQGEGHTAADFRFSISPPMRCSLLMKKWLNYVYNRLASVVSCAYDRHDVVAHGRPSNATHVITSLHKSLLVERLSWLINLSVSFSASRHVRHVIFITTSPTTPSPLQPSTFLLGSHGCFGEPPAVFAATMTSGALQRCYSSIVHTEYLQGPVGQCCGQEPPMHWAALWRTFALADPRYGGPSLWRTGILRISYTTAMCCSCRSRKMITDQDVWVWL